MFLYNSESNLELASPFFKSSKLYQLSGIIFSSKASIDRNIVLEHHDSKNRKALLIVISVYKKGKVECLKLLVYTAIKRVTCSIKVKLIMEEAWEI
ncbi:hypothetical protein [Viridibacillus arvi]|uniref:Uncharacterized protein n=1 Tax=Viridibacillus arvi TaxID=263475 RepID=A0A0M0LDA0_9BACL|nr:hypothetical protein [Viridibacillus arvi]KOO49035.1 hypothetical protein AMD00_11590 [Viridibacillus arvi]